MKPTADNDRIIIKYLLNDLSEEDRAQLEEAYLRDESLFDQIQAMEEELIEDYVKGRLSGYERERFEQHYLASREQRARVETVRQLDRACSLTPPDPALAGARIARQPSSVRSWQRAMGRPRSVLMLGAAAFLLILGLGMFAELLRLRGRLAAINREQAALEARIEESDRTLSRFREELAEERQQDLPLREKLKNITTRPDRLKPEKVPPSPSKEQVVSLALAPNMRAPGGIDKAVISADTRFVELKIAILAPGQQLIRAVAKTVDGKREIWTEEWPAARQPRSAGAVSMLIPADRFRAAEAQVYSLTLSRPSPEGRADQEFEIRYFRVISK